MAKVPTTGQISMTALKNARSIDGTGGTTSNTYSVIRNGANFNLFDPTYLQGATQLSQVNAFSQWRNYPRAVTLGFFNGSVFKILPLPNGKILVGGGFTTYNGFPCSGIVRLNVDGTIDNTFNVGTGFNSGVRDIALQADGKIIVVGGFTSYNGASSYFLAPVGTVTLNHIVRLNTNGSIDQTFFGVGSGFNAITLCLLITSTGLIYVGGQFTTYKGVSYNRIVRLDQSGFVDTNFNVGTGFNSNIVVIKQVGSTQILVGGAFTTYKGFAWGRLIKLFSDGSIDGFTFQQNAGFNGAVFDIEVEADGKILVGGLFTSHNNVPTINRFAILNSNNTLNDRARMDGDVISVKRYNTDSILIGGDFTLNVDYFIPANRILSLNNNMTINTSFVYGSGFDGIVRDIEVEADGNILIGGDFTSYNGVMSQRIVRLLPNGTRV